MEKRLGLAFALTAILMVVWYWIAPPVAPPPQKPAAATTAPAAPAAPSPAAGVPTLAPAPAGTAARTVRVRSGIYEYDFSTRGATLAGAQLLRFPSYVHRGETVQLVPRGAADVLGQTLITAGRTYDLRSVDFQPSAARIDLAPGSPAQTLRFTYAPGGTPVAEIAYTFRPNDYAVDVQGRVFNAGGAGTLYTSLGTGLAPHDAKEHGTQRELSFVAWNGRRVERHYLAKLQGQDTIVGPLAWAGIKDRYFLLGLIPQKGELTRLVAQDAPDERYSVGTEQLVSPRAAAVVSMPVGSDGAFAYKLYMGPLEHSRMVAMGHQLEEVNPYGYRWLRPVVRPIAAFVLWALREMHDKFGIGYGWVLIIFGALVRLVTWPLNARAMRSQMKNMAVQPELQRRTKEIQERYGKDPQRMQQETLKMYQELGVNPLSMMSGCLPMLIPMPVLITLFFVFQGAIEFRGAHFAWLPDLSLKDPYFILPIFLVASMFALQWVSTKLSGMEQNDQAKMMMYTMPLMMGIFFWFMPSGLNLYYATSNIASLPQQYLIAMERRKANLAAKVKTLPGPGAKKPGGSPKKELPRRPRG